METALKPATRSALEWALPAALLLLVPVAAIVYFADVPALPIRGAPYFLLTWAIAAGLGAGYGALTHATWRRSLGMSLMLVGLVTTLVSIANDIAPLVAGGREIVPLTRYQLSTFYMRKLLTDLGYIGVGFLLWAGWVPGWTLADIAAKVRAVGVPMGRRPESHSMRLGLAWFPVLLFGTILFDYLVSQQLPGLINNDEGGIWSQSNPWNVTALSAAAALGEEVLYRGLMLVLAIHGARRLGLSNMGAMMAGILLQAVIFGFAHASYGNWLHVIEATMFGLISGAAAVWLGIWAAIVLHFLIDIFAIGVHVQTPGWGEFLVLLLVGLSAYSLWCGGRWAVRRWPPSDSGRDPSG